MSRVLEIASNKFIGGDNLPFVIAEAGINHQGDIEIAKELIRTAKMVGADCVKFQKRTINRILTKEGLERPYDNPNSFGKTYGEHKEALELSEDEFKKLKRYADEVNILFTASGWDEESIDFLESIDVPFFKMASADLTNFPLLEHTAKKGKPMILSTGMANMDTVKAAYDLVSKINDKVVLLQCTSTYPAAFKHINLRVIETYQKAFPEAVIGYSGHENGIAISLAAVVMGAKVVERHFTLDRTMKGGDHAASLEPFGLQKLIRDIKAFEEAKGDGEKIMYEVEKPCFEKLSKSIVTKERIIKNTEIRKEMITTKGPGKGISPMDLEKIIGKKVNKDIDEDHVLYWEDLN